MYNVSVLQRACMVLVCRSYRNCFARDVARFFSISGTTKAKMSSNKSVFIRTKLQRSFGSKTLNSFHNLLWVYLYLSIQTTVFACDHATQISLSQHVHDSVQHVLKPFWQWSTDWQLHNVVARLWSLLSSILHNLQLCLHTAHCFVQPKTLYNNIDREGPASIYATLIVQ